MKGQCARDYFYGNDGQLEKTLQEPEGVYADIVRRAEADPNSLNDQDHHDLREFVFLQSRRSLGAVEKMLAAWAEMDEFLASKGGKMPEGWVKLTRDDAIRMAMETFLETRHYIRDLATSVIADETRVPFLTSDDPSIHVNRFHAQKTRAPGGDGIASSGATFYLPLGPKLAFVVYDPNVYHVPDRKGRLIAIRRDADADDINQMQFLHARRILYFRDWSDVERIAERLAEDIDLRPRRWHENSFFVPTGDDDDKGTEYKRVDTDTARDSKKVMFNYSGVKIEPRRWPRWMPFRLNHGTKTQARRRGLVDQIIRLFVSTVGANGHKVQLAFGVGRGNSLLGEFRCGTR